ncbi:MAG TPA: MFS transporter [Savagea sp.]
MQEGYTLRDRAFWFLVFGLGLASMFTFSAMYATQPLMPKFTEQFQVSVSLSSMTMSVMTIGLICGLVVVGVLSDRNGRSQFVKWSLLLSAIPFFIIPFLPSFSLILLLRFIQGFTMAGVPAVGLAYLNEEIHPKYQGLATALYISCNGLGGMIGRIFTGILAERYSWELAFFLIGSAGIVILILLMMTLPKSNYFTPSVVSLKKDIDGFFYHLRNPKLLMVFGLGFILQLSFTGTWTYLPFYLAEAPFSLSLDKISLIYAAYSFGIIGAPIAGYLAARYTVKRVRAIALFVLVSGVLLTLNHSLPIVVIGMCVVCGGFFTAHSLTATTVSQEATHHKGSASSLYLISYYIGVAGGSTLLSPVWEYAGWFGIVMSASCIPLLYYAMLRLYQRKQTI